MASTPTTNETRTVWLLAAAAFINVLDFMIVMPMGPDFADKLGIPLSRLGFVAGSYTAAAAVAGIAGSFILDSFDRRKAFIVCLVGLGVGTASAALATGFASLVAARCLAGAFGGPATSMSNSIVADVVAPERRGRAMATIMAGFVVASVLGVPAGLELASRGGWRAPFLVIACLAFAIAGTVLVAMPRHRASPRPRGHVAPPFLTQPSVLLALASNGLVFFSSFSVIPHLAAYLQYNLGFPRERLGLLYLVGGVVSFVTIRITGRLIDKHGSLPILVFGTATLLVVFAFGFMPAHPVVPATALFVGLMLSNSTRIVSINALSSLVPAPEVRGRFMSASSTVQHLGSALGGALSALILEERADKSLGHMPWLAACAMAASAVIPSLVQRLERRVRAR
jgi:predicted MFS family arabinose efflux permease